MSEKQEIIMAINMALMLLQPKVSHIKDPAIQTILSNQLASLQATLQQLAVAS